MRDAFFPRLLFIQSDAGDFRINECRPRHNRVIRLEFLEVAKQRVDGCIPGLMCRGVGELVRPGDVAGGEDVRVDRFQVLVGLYRALRRYAQRLQPVAREPRSASDSTEQDIEFDTMLLLAILDHDELAVGFTFAAYRLVARQDLYAITCKSNACQLGNFWIFPDHDARSQFDLRDA